MSENRNKIVERCIQLPLSALTLRGMKANVDLYSLFSLPVISTGRSFAYYRKIFFGNASERQVLDTLRGKLTVDIGCGLTPYVSDSMFQVCRQADIDFYGVDPKLADGFSFGVFDFAKVRAVGGRGRIDPDAPGLEKGIGRPADDLPFDDESVDLILSNFLLYAWIREEDSLEKIYREFHRVLKTGGEVRIYPTSGLDLQRIRDPGLRQIMEAFEIQNVFTANWLNLAQYPPAYMMTMTKG